MRNPAFQGFLIPFLLTAIAVGGIAGCAVNPVSGAPDVVFMTESKEIQLGYTNDSKIRKQYGVYGNPELQTYVEQVGQKLAALSHRPGLKYRFTVLDSPEVNAFALPGGFVYITRGILAYINTEAELAAVLGHEIGHVTARHAVRQYTAATSAGFVGMIVGATTGIPVTQDLANILGNTVVSGFGRDHELESDRLGAEYLAHAGYDPQAMIAVIGILKNQEEFEKNQAAAEHRPPKIYHGVFASHPSADQRLREVVGEADKFKTLAVPKIGREDYLNRIDKLAFGKTVKGGIVFDNHYYRPDIDLVIDFPKGWSLAQASDTVSAISGDQQVTLQLDVQNLDNDLTPDGFLQWFMQLSAPPKGSPLKGLSPPSYSAILPTAPGFSETETRASVLYLNNKRLLFQGTAKTPQAFTAADPLFLAAARSLHPLKPEEKQSAQQKGLGQRVRIIPAAPGETFATLAKKSPLGNNSEIILLLINGKFPFGEARAGESIKIIE
jgi:predicted Zn-dependent protease